MAGQVTQASEDIAGGLAGYWLRAIDTIPDGESAPSADYDITLEDEDGFDILSGAGADHSDSVQERAIPLVGTTPITVPVGGGLTLKIASNEVNGAKGAIRLYFSKNPS